MAECLHVNNSAMDGLDAKRGRIIPESLLYKRIRVSVLVAESS
jgi:hypothetical protein